MHLILCPVETDVNQLKPQWKIAGSVQSRSAFNLAVFTTRCCSEWPSLGGDPIRVQRGLCRPWEKVHRSGLPPLRLPAALSRLHAPEPRKPWRPHNEPQVVWANRRNERKQASFSMFTTKTWVVKVGYVFQSLFQIWVHKRSHAEIQGTVKSSKWFYSDSILNWIEQLTLFTL